jgi:hypothetical protein
MAPSENLLFTKPSLIDGETDSLMSEKDNTTAAYTCKEYRMEMILLALEKQMARPDLTPSEKESIQTEIQRVKKEMDMV